MVERELIMNKGNPLQFAELRNAGPVSASSQFDRQQLGALSLDEVNANHILRILNATNGKIHGDDGAAKMLGINPSTLRGRMKKLGIPFRGYSQYK